MSADVSFVTTLSSFMLVLLNNLINVILTGLGKQMQFPHTQDPLPEQTMDVFGLNGGVEREENRQY